MECLDSKLQYPDGSLKPHGERIITAIRSQQRISKAIIRKLHVQALKMDAERERNYREALGEWLDAQFGHDGSTAVPPQRHGR